MSYPTWTMPTVVALIVDRRERERLVPVLRTFGDVRFCDRQIEVWQTLGDSDVVGVVTNPIDGDGRPIAPTAEELRRLFPSLPIVVHSGTNSPEQHRALASLSLTPGLTVVNGHGGPDLAAVTRECFASARVQSPAAALLEVVAALNPPLDPLVNRYVRTVIRLLHWPLSVRSVMTAIDSTKRRALEAQLQLANLPTAEHIIGWVFALHTTWLLALPGSTVDAVSRRLGFDDPSTLRSVFKNRVGAAPTSIMRLGGFDYLRERFSALLRADWSREPPGRRRGPRVRATPPSG
jgi:AraC-like DNA-binding protein